MSKEKREKIFTEYIKNINLLIDENLINAEKDTYYCPLCLKGYKSLCLAENDFLTLEDAPPKSLGGKANILTCKDCNNEAGTKIDSHLVERMKELENKQLLPKSEMKVLVDIDEDTFNATLSVDENNKMSLSFSSKNNNPNVLNPIMEETKKDKRINFSFPKTKVNSEKLEYSILKTAYLLFFQKTGYSLIFDESYDIIREQIKNTEKRIYPYHFWGYNEPGLSQGLYFVIQKDYESVMMVFNLKADKIERSFIVFLPVPKNNKSKVIIGNSKIELEMYDGNNDNYLCNVQSISKLMSWAYY